MDVTTNGVAAPTIANPLLAMIVAAKAKSGAQTFDLATFTCDESSTGNFGFSGLTEQGTFISFWEKYEKSGLTMLDCVEWISGTKYRIASGAKISEPDEDDICAIIPAGAKAGGFFKRKK
jgi:hypothetical protein